MEASDKKPNKTLKENKEYFSAYLNMARHNAYLTLAHLTKRIGSKPVGKEEDLQGMDVIQKLTNSDPLKKNHALRLLEQHFPFINAELKDHSKEESKEEFFKSLFKAINDYRNFYTHQKHEPIDLPDELNKNFENIFNAAIKTVKERFKLDESRVKHLGRPKGKGKDGKPKKNPAFFYQFQNDDKTITEKGLAFLICLFLEKQYAYTFLKKLKGFKRSDTKAHRATLEVFTVARMKMPKERIQVGDPEIALGLDMLNELGRLPKPLVKLLENDKVKEFRVKEDEPTESQDDSNGDKNDDLTYLLYRKKDRFPYFAMAYLDKMDTKKRYHFQVDLGTYHFKFYEKNNVDGQTRLKSLDKRLKTFGNPLVLEEKRRTAWEAIIKDNPPENYDQPHIRDTIPHYHIVDNQIGIRFDSPGLPNVQPDTVPENQKPNAWLSIYELPAMVFYQWLTREDTTHSVTRVLTSYSKKIRSYFSAIAEGDSQKIRETRTVLEKEFGFHDLMLPKELRMYLNDKGNQKKYGVYADRILKKMLTETENKLKKKDNKAGDMADFLARDMLRLQPLSEEKRKVTAQDFQVLQKSLAFYGLYKNQLRQIFINCKLWQGEMKHPFLDALAPEKHNGIAEFYENYLKKRKTYLKQCLKDKRYAQYPFLKKGEKWQTTGDEHYKRLAIKLADNQNPINIPRGLFLHAIIESLQQSGNEDLNMVLRTDGQHNCQYLINKYFELIEQDAPQAFYSYPRTYDFINKMKERKQDFNPLQQEYLKEQARRERFKTLQEEVKGLPQKPDQEQGPPRRGEIIPRYKESMQSLMKKMRNTERKLRLMASEDRLLFIMARELLINAKQKVDIKDFKLKDIGSPEEGKSVLSKQVAVSLVVHGKTITGTMKIKNFGNLYRYAHDRRLKSLFQCLPENEKEIKADELKEELANYEKARLSVLAKVHSFENAVCESFPVAAEDKYKKKLEEKTKEGGKAFLGFHDIICIVKKNIKDDELKKKLNSLLNSLRKVRNKFSHNKYPGKIGGISNKPELPCVAYEIETFASTKFEEVMKTFVKEDEKND